jgi:hypothetical protein
MPTRVLNQALKRNGSRSPSDFAFQLAVQELPGIQSQPVIASNRSQIVTTSIRNVRPLLLPPPELKRREIGFHARLASPSGTKGAKK